MQDSAALHVNRIAIANVLLCWCHDFFRITFNLDHFSARVEHCQAYTVIVAVIIEAYYSNTC